MSAIGVYHLDTEGIPYSANILIGCICIIFNCEKKMQKKMKTRFNAPYSRMTASGFKTRLSAQTTYVLTIIEKKVLSFHKFPSDKVLRKE